ncbi:tRNA (N(6)-L-threonylcarbamoyladenosine(37)-C(2))-methylthiotransferase MtaB [Clostridia bacterium]|nr:tRNA (N(6)-L-threonylcarbamoyladenosine(37)-C(2))-methylthiotransferase MtaB [Clostridia bacterium]
MKYAALHNLGCKVNAYESTKMQELLEKDGYTIVPFIEKADVYIVNTCSVTSIAGKKSRQILHRARKLNPNAILIAVGCYVEAEKEELQKEQIADILIDNQNKENILDYLHEWLKENNVKFSLSKEKSFNIVQKKNKTRALLKIQDGCHQFCTYCIIPYLRGKVRSVPLQQVIEEAKKLVEQGFLEIILTGIHLSSYGMDFEDQAKEEKSFLLVLLERLQKIPGLLRIRLGSLEPRIITREFVETIKTLPSLCPHFHLSLQSGSDSVLKRMNRHYNTGEYQKACQLLRENFINPALTTDVIVGFPGETIQEHETSKKFVREIAFSDLHVFKYSSRKGTKAEKLPDQINEKIKNQRSEEFLDLTAHLQENFRKWYKNQVVDVLWEEKIEKDGEIYLTGYTKEYVKVAIAADEARQGQITSCQLLAYRKDWSAVMAKAFAH